MPSADLLATVERARAWPARVRKIIASIALFTAAAVAITQLDPRASGYVRASLDEIGVWPAAAAPAAERPSSVAAAKAVAEPARQKPVDREEAVDPPAAESAPAVALRSRKLGDWLADIAASADRGLILAPEVSGEATAHFEDATSWQERLAALARIHGFHYAVGDRLIEAWVRPRADDTSVVAMNDDVPAADDEARNDAGERAPSDRVNEAPPVAQVVRPTNARATDLVSAVSKAAKAGHVEVAPDAGSNSVVVAGAEKAVDEIAALVRSLDVPRRRFVLEAEIVEMSSNAREELGIRWSIDGTVGAIVDFPAADAPGESSGIIVATMAHTRCARVSTRWPPTGTCTWSRARASSCSKAARLRSRACASCVCASRARTSSAKSRTARCRAGMRSRRFPSA
jgi:hypothetical protein